MEPSTSSIDNQTHGEGSRMDKTEYNIAGPSTVYNRHQTVTIQDINAGRDVNINISSPHDEDNSISPVMYGLPVVGDYVTGRDKEVKDLYELVKKNYRVVITGIGGVGKTTLAQHCARLWLSNPQYEIHKIAVINAETCDTFHQDIVGLAIELNIKTNGRQTREIINQIFNSFSNTNILMVYDNINTYDVVQDFLPDISHVYILATSQITELKSFFTIYELKCLEREAGVDMVKHFLSEENFAGLEEESLYELVDTLGCLPLAILQASAYIKDEIEYNDSQFTINDYLQKYNSYLNEPFPDDFRTNNKRTVYISLQLNISKIKQELSIQILNSMAYLNPNNITITSFIEHYGEKYAKSALRVLMKYSLVKKEQRYCSLNFFITKRFYEEYLVIHRLVQEICRTIHENHNYISLAFAIIVKSPYLYIHYNYLYSRVDKQLIIQLSSEGYQEAFKHGHLFDKLTKKLQSLNVNTSVILSWDAWNFAAYLGDLFILRFFEQNQLVYKHGKSDWTPLHSASIGASFKFYESFTYTIKHLIDFKTSEGLTALHISSALCDSYIVNTLIGSGCDINLCDKSGNTALHWACLFENTDTINVLINCGIDQQIKNNDGRLALQMHHLPNDGNCAEGLTKGVLVSKTSLSEKPMGEEFILLTFFQKSEGEKYMIEQLQICDWWYVQQEVFVKELVIKLCESQLAITVATALIINEDLTVQEVLKMLNENKCHPVVVKFMNNCSIEARQYENVFLIICLALDKLKDRNNIAFNYLSHMIYCNGFDEDDNRVFEPLDDFTKEMCSLMKTRKTDINKCMQVLIQYNLLESDTETFINKWIQQIIHTYSQHVGTALDISHNVLKYYLNCSLSFSIELLDIMTEEDIRAFYVKEFETSEEIQKINCFFHKAGYNLPSLDNWSALHWACADIRRGSWCIVQRLIELKAEINLQVDGIAPIHIASFIDPKTSKYLMFALLQADVDVTIRANGGWTALHFAVIANNHHATNELISSGADVNAVNVDGDSALHLAARYGRKAIIDQLQEADADTNLPNLKGQTPADLLNIFYNIDNQPVV